MNELENKVVRFGLDSTRSLSSALFNFIRWYTELKYHRSDKSKKDNAESKEYTDLIQFYRDQYKQGNTQFIHDGVSTQSELNKFSQLAKQYGVSYYIEKRPPDLMKTFQKAQNQEALSRDEQETLSRWVVQKDGKETLNGDEYQLTLAVRDAKKIEALLKDLVNWRKENLETRIDQSKQMYREQDKEKGLDSIELPEPERGI